jgi:hypothetical protein
MKKSTLASILLILLIIITGMLLSCEKDLEKDWRLEQQMLIYRTKCGPDTINVIRFEKAKTGKEIIIIMDEYEYQRWMKKSELLFIPIYEVLELADSTWVESKIMKIGYTICI